MASRRLSFRGRGCGCRVWGGSRGGRSWTGGSSSWIAAAVATLRSKVRLPRVKRKNALAASGLANARWSMESIFALWKGEEGRCVVVIHELVIPKSQFRSLYQKTKSYFKVFFSPSTAIAESPRHRHQPSLFWNNWCNGSESGCQSKNGICCKNMQAKSKVVIV